MGYEIEVKYRCDDHEAVAGRLREIGAEAGEAVAQEDLYLAHPSRDFAASGEAFRLRRDGVTNRVTYKGPKLGGPTKTREEVEVAFAEGDRAFADLRRIVEALGFRAVASVRKVRRAFHVERAGRGLEVVLDEAEGLGSFAEVEALAEGEDDLARAQAAVLALAAEIGLAEVEPRSYLRLFLERDGRLVPKRPGQA